MTFHLDIWHLDHVKVKFEGQGHKSLSGVHLPGKTTVVRL